MEKKCYALPLLKASYPCHEGLVTMYLSWRLAMNREEYRSLLERLPIKSPTPEDIALMCPHVAPDEAVRILNTESGYIACPPLRIRGAFQIICYSPERTVEISAQGSCNGEATQVITGTKSYPSMLSLAHVGRTARSYADGNWRNDFQTQYASADEAMRFAEDNWGDELILDSWISVLNICLQDPSDLVNDCHHHDSPRTKALLTLALNRGFNCIVNDYSTPKSEQLDEAIVDMTIDHRVSREFLGGRGGYNEYNCAYCAAGLSLSGCSGCGHRFRDDQYRSGWGVPLSKKMVAFLCEKGHVFNQNPQVAWDQERKTWEGVQERICSMTK